MNCTKCGNKVEPAIQEFFDEAEAQRKKYLSGKVKSLPDVCGSCLAEHFNIDPTIQTTNFLIH